MSGKIKPKLSQLSYHLALLPIELRFTDAAFSSPSREFAEEALQSLESIMPSRGNANMGRIDEETPAGAAAGGNNRRARDANGRNSRPVSMQLESPGSGAGGDGKTETASSSSSGGQRLGNDVMPDLLPAGAQSSQQAGEAPSNSANASSSNAQEKVRTVRCTSFCNPVNRLDHLLPALYSQPLLKVT